ncbi:hypothetical protein COCSUDRAFT_67012 [Coccomyxa subellipsoidea C-169]|uniref:RanBP2-type domain-containing protein n=1 Tax=Coccomyxa subellipsoidea (strain C-169) TaxID=574566 RepID=I0YTH6_COCSC|nr:hypothetical protein COCSUDRAFT_67012 [Coccomyxa subellipsoidea C-169]EIE21695.1 hypothetical protein COCSUDRAFT_67012 [Coccomyxa subellipsoidea C-169]|eukprot:XP_005646239.1 hypothetical protein COCSUDRAFT_67012 [Coccomyxa subellipsoidea C-169]
MTGGKAAWGGTADAGIKCPFCRQFVEGYFPINDGAGKGNPALVEANRAARAAAVARQPVVVKKQAAVHDVLPPSDWECAKCQNINFSARSKCNKCGQPGPKGAPAIIHGAPSGDVLKCTDKELRDCALEKMHPNFQQAFQEAGTPAQTGLVPGAVGGNADSVIAAMSKRGQDRLHHVIRILAEKGHVKELATAFYGNYTVQDLLDATHKFRQAAAKLRARKTAASQDIERMLGFSDGQDSLGRMARGIAGAMPEGAMHKQGIYVVLKLLEVGDCADILPLASKLFPGGPKLTTDLHSPEAWRGVKIMTGLVDAMSELAHQGGHMSAAAMGLLDSLCGLYLKDEQAVIKLAQHKNYGPMLVDAASAGLPRPKCKQVKSWTNQPSPAFGASLVWKILQRLDDEDENSWVKSIVNELFKCLGSIQSQLKALDMLSDALCLKGVPDHAVASHMQMLHDVLGDARAEEMLKNVERQRGAKVAQQPHNKARSGGVQPGAGGKCPVQFGSLNGHEDYSSVFASPPRNLPAAKAPAAPHPSILGPPFVPPPAQPQPPPPLAPPPAAPIPNGILQSGPLLPIPPPTQMANGTRPPPPQRLMVSPRGQGYKPGPPPGAPAAVPAPLAHLIPHLMMGAPAPPAPAAPRPAAPPPVPAPAPAPSTSMPSAAVNGHHRAQQTGPAPAAGPPPRMPVITPPAEHRNARPAQNGIHPPGATRQAAQAPAAPAARMCVLRLRLT